ncbi:hypothetical protein Fot_20099 [Forsythia ovata]|uniref:Uncharacterized protein n=1 Tax=Forsythia ovata TaxID=205694 RepID=A0ABD1VN21_9LAMI
MDIDDKHFDDPDSDDEANNHLSGVGRSRLSSRYFGQARSLQLKVLVVAEDAMTRAVYDVTKSGTIQMMCAQAQKKSQSQLRSCQNMVHAKDKELTEALAELSKAKDLLVNLGVPGYADP